MIPIARGQAVIVGRVIHACWSDDAVRRIDCGHGNITEEPMVLMACGAYAEFQCVQETDVAIDCMSCLVRHERYDQDLDEDSPH